MSSNGVRVVKTTITPFHKVLQNHIEKAQNNYAYNNGVNNGTSAQGAYNTAYNNASEANGPVNYNNAANYNVPNNNAVSNNAANNAAVNGNSATGGVSENSEVLGANGGVGKTFKTTLDDIFKRASKKYGVSYNFLVAVAKAESDFNPNCVSSAGAKGIMQIMPYEAKELGVDNVFDAEQNIMASAKLLAAHLEKFNGDFTLAAAAYNAGSGRVQQYGGVPPFTETQNYVKKINRFMKEGVKVPDKTVTVTANKLSKGTFVQYDDTSNKYINYDMKAAQAVKNQQVASNDEEEESVKKNEEASAVKKNEAANEATKKAVEKKETTESNVATEEELDKTMVVVGSGTGAVTMTYGAYLKYLELGSLGVG